MNRTCAGAASAAIFSVSVIMLGAAPVPAGAQTPIELEEILVTGSRTPIGTSAIGRAFTVITGEELERQGVRYVADALKKVPGLAVSRSGGSNGFTQVRIRGGEANHVLVLIDGVEVSRPESGEFDFGALTTADIERIEILRGPQSSLWGANAAAGVISIITRAGRRESLERGATVETGTDGTIAGSGFVRGGGADWDASVSAAWRRSSGFDVSTAGNGEKDGDRNLTLNAKGHWDLGDNFSLGASAHVIDRTTETDEQVFFGPDAGRIVDDDDETAETNGTLALWGDWRLLDDALTQTLRFEFTGSSVDFTDGGVTVFTTEGERLHGSWQATYAFETGPAAHALTGAVELEREINEASTGDQTRDILGLVAEYRGTFFDVFDLQASIRRDINDPFPDATTYSVGGSWRHAPTGTRLHASIGEGVTNPTFFEQFGAFPPFFFGNPDVRPERVFMWDAGIEQRLLDDRLVVDVTYFRGHFEDEIVTVFDPGLGANTTANATGKSPRQGIEVSATMRPIEPLAITASYTWTDAEDALTGAREVRRPKHTASLDATLALFGGRGEVSLGLSYTGKQTDLDFSTFPSSTVTLDDFLLVDLAARYRLTDTVELFGRIENLTDTEYEEVFNFSSQGITAFAGVRIRF